MSPRKVTALLCALFACIAGGGAAWLLVRGRAPGPYEGLRLWSACVAEAYPQTGVLEISGVTTETATITGIRRSETTLFHWWLGDNRIRVEFSAGRSSADDAVTDPLSAAPRPSYVAVWDGETVRCLLGDALVVESECSGTPEAAMAALLYPDVLDVGTWGHGMNPISLRYASTPEQPQQVRMAGEERLGEVRCQVLEAVWGGGLRQRVWIERGERLMPRMIETTGPLWLLGAEQQLERVPAVLRGRLFASKEYADELLAGVEVGRTITIAQAVVHGADDDAGLWEVGGGFALTVQREDFVKYGGPPPSEPELLAGQLAPDLAMTDSEGIVRQVGELEGRPIILLFFASWCGPCQRQLAEMHDLTERLGIPATWEAARTHEGPVLVGVLLDRDPQVSAWRETLAEHDVRFPVLVPTTREKALVEEAYELGAHPRTIVIAPSGLIARDLSRVVGADELERAAAEAEGAKALPRQERRNETLRSADLLGPSMLSMEAQIPEARVHLGNAGRRQRQHS